MEWVLEPATGQWVLYANDGRGRLQTLPPGVLPPDDGIPKFDGQGKRVDYPDNGGANGTMGADTFTVDRAVELLSQIANDPARAGVGGPGLPGMGLVGDWIDALKRRFGQYWWLLLVAGVVLIVAADNRR